MKLHTLPKIINKQSKRKGRGIGSGLGKTAGRGTKGQKARGKIPLAFTGAGLPMYKKLPKRAGLGNRKVSSKMKLIKLSQLTIYKPKTVVDLEQLLNSKLINKNDAKIGVKILAEGKSRSNRDKLSVPLIVKLPVSRTALKEIESVGGKVEHV